MISWCQNNFPVVHVLHADLNSLQSKLNRMLVASAEVFLSLSTPVECITDRYILPDSLHQVSQIITVDHCYLGFKAGSQYAACSIAAYTSDMLQALVICCMH